MVRSSKRLTRKDIRRPDPFITFTGQFLRFLDEHKAAVFVSAGLLLAVLLGIWGWQSYSRSQNLLAAEQFSDGVALYRKGEYQEAIESLERVKTYHSSTYLHLAELYQANSHLALKEYNNAAEALEELLRKETKDRFLRQTALLTLGYTHEKAGRCDQAVNAFTQAHEITGPRQEQALLGKARCQLKIGNHKEALETYRQHLSDYPNSEQQTATELRIQELEAKVGLSGGGK